MPYDSELIVGMVGFRTVSVVAVVVVLGVVSGRARRIESARAVESRVIESRRAVSMRASESARATESRRIVSIRIESARATESAVVERVVEVGRLTSPLDDSFVTRTRCCDVVRRVVSDVVRRVESGVVRRVVSACAEAVELAPNTSATATALANEYLTFICILRTLSPLT